MEDMQFLRNPGDILDTNFVLRREEIEPSGAFYELNTDACIKPEECINLNPLLSNTLDEFNGNLNNVETLCDTNIKNTISAHNYKNDNTRYMENQNQPIVNTQSPNISGTVDDFLILNPGNELTDLFNNIDEKCVALNPNVFSELNNETNYENSLDYYTPANSLSPVSFSQRKNVVPLMQLDLKTFINNTDELNTPNIIDYLDDMFETTDTVDVMTRVSTPESTSPSHTDEVPSISNNSLINNSLESSIISDDESVKSNLKKEIVVDSDYEYDSDEDYVPPLKLKKSSRKTTTLRNEKVPKRGRPPKRNKSISSDDYSQLDPEDAKYREMRDRNNEASRKSRYKRKQSEQTMFQEVELLERENIRLKTQVEELQKTVAGYRDNLMKVMLNKK